MSQQGPRRVLILVARLLLVALLVYAVRSLDVRALGRALQSVRPPWLLVAVCAFLAILPLWALEWWLLAPPAPHRTPASMFPIVAMTSSVLNTAPLLLGEGAGVMLLVTRAGLSKTAGVTVLLLDQLFVGLAKLAVLTAAAFITSLPRWLSAAIPALLIAVGTLILILLLVVIRPNLFDRVAGARTLAARRLAANIGDGLRVLRSPVRVAVLLSLAVAKKGCELAGILCVQAAFGMSPSLSAGMLVLAALAVSTLLPIMPGSLGIYEATTVLAYLHVGVEPERALGLALVQHATFLVCLALPGYRWLLMMERGSGALQQDPRLQRSTIRD